MKPNRWKWAYPVALLALAAVVAGGCTAAGNGNVEQPATETPAEESSGAGESSGSEEPAAEAPGAEEPGAEQPAASGLSVTTGAEVQIETSIEGMAEQVEVTEYVIEPYGIKYQLRSAMGEPAVENGQVVYRTQMGDDVATVAVEVWTDTALEDALKLTKEQYASDGFAGSEVRDASTETLTGKVSGFQEDGYYIGYHVYALGSNAVVIHRSYPFDAGDGMAAVLNEMITSLKG